MYITTLQPHDDDTKFDSRQLTARTNFTGNATSFALANAHWMLRLFMLPKENHHSALIFFCHLPLAPKLQLVYLVVK